MTVEQELAQHRFKRAQETLKEAENQILNGNYRLSVNRAYYSAFYGMRSLLATVRADSSKHSGVMALFNREFIKTGKFTEVAAKEIQTLMDLRHEGDYEDFFEVSKQEAESALEMARHFVSGMVDFFAKNR